MLRFVAYGHVECTYTADTSKWSSPRWVTDPNLRVHGLSSGLNYGLQCFEGIRAYRTPDNRIALFRPRKNAARLGQSAAFVGIPPVPESLFLRAVHLCVAANAAFIPPSDSTATMYIRPTLFGSGAQISLAPPQHFTFCVYVTPIGSYHGTTPQDALILENLDRAAPRGTGHLKLGGNYAPIFRFAADARSQGFGITLHLDSSTRSEIDEFANSGFIGVKRHGRSDDDGASEVTLVVPDSASILKSVTSESACELAESFGWEVQRRPVPYSELSTFQEVIAAGTAAALVPIKSITMQSQGDVFKYDIGDKSQDESHHEEETETVVSKLTKALRGIQKGETKDQFGWLEYVEEPPELGELLVPRSATAEAPKINGVGILA